MSELSAKIQTAKKVRWNELQILVVEDEADLREILTLVFEQEGCHVNSAKDGLQALEILKTFKPDLIISDVRMPNCDGIELLEKLRSQNPAEPPVFLATGFADINEAQARAKGATNLIHKPFNIQDLFLTLEASLQNHRSFNKWD